MEFSSEQAIMVTGSSGWLGRSLVQQLREHAPVVALYRHCLPEPQDKVYPVWCDLANAELIPAALRGVQAVVHLAWDDDADGSAPPNNKKAFQNLVKSMADEGVHRLIVVSALGVKRDADTFFLREKYEMECCAVNSKIPYITIWRPAPLFGGQAVSDRFLRCLYNAARMPLLHPEVLEEALSPLHRDDFVSALIQDVLDTPSKPLSILEAVGPDSYPVGELLCEVATAMGKGMSLGVRGPIGRLLLKVLERKPEYLGRKLFYYGCFANIPQERYPRFSGSVSFKEVLHALPFQKPLEEHKLAVDIVGQATPVRLDST